MSFFVRQLSTLALFPVVFNPPIIQRYRKEGPNKRFSLGITSPMPKDFLRICMDMGIAHSLDKREVMGGVTVEGVPCKEVPEVEGKSLL